LRSAAHHRDGATIRGGAAMVRNWTAGVFALSLLAPAAGALAQTPPADETPGANVHQSQQYEQLLCTNPAFRAKRVAQECGPLQGSTFYDGCVASFNCKNPNAPKGTNWRNTPPSER
jgi:hypothetical protein